MEDVNEILKSLKDGKCCDPDGLIREKFKEDVIGEDLRKSMLIFRSTRSRKQKLFHIS